MTNAKPALAIEIGPMLEDIWTGIPVFTRRLISALIQDGRLDLRFVHNYIEIPVDAVRSAMLLGAGSFLRERYEQLTMSERRILDLNTPVLYPSSKSNLGGIYAREASTVHDLSTLVMPENHVEANVAYHMDHFGDELESNELTFAISQSTDAALQSAFPSTAGRTQLLYQYVDWPDEFEVLDRNSPRIDIGRYAVVIGTVEPRKNLTLLIEALSHPDIAASEIKFVIIGKRGWLVDSFLQEIPKHLRDRLIFSGFVSDFIKYRLIKAAEFMIFPSMYEGFGIPALEAMSLGKPVMAAMTSSFPEVIGEGGIYFDPFSVTEFAEAFAEIVSPSRAAELAAKALKQSSIFNPPRMAAPVVEWVCSG